MQLPPLSPAERQFLSQLVAGQVGQVTVVRWDTWSGGQVRDVGHVVRWDRWQVVRWSGGEVL